MARLPSEATPMGHTSYSLLLTQRPLAIATNLRGRQFLVNAFVEELLNEMVVSLSLVIICLSNSCGHNYHWISLIVLIRHQGLEVSEGLRETLATSGIKQLILLPLRRLMGQ